MANQFESIVSAKSVGTADVQAQADAMRKLSDSIDGLATKANKVNEHPGFGAFASKVREGIENPLGSAGSAVEGFLTKLGPVGVGVAGIATAFATVGAAGMAFARDLGALGDSIEDTSARMGLSTKETQEFSFAMKYAGGTMGTLEGTMRKLSTEVESGGKNLQKMGIDFRDLRTGELRPTSDILLQLADRWGKETDARKRNSEATSVLGRSALAVLPDLIALREGLKRSNGESLLSEDDLLQFKRMHETMAVIDRDWDYLKTKFKQGLAASFMFIFHDSKGNEYSLDDLAKRGVNLGQWAPRTDAQNRQAARDAGFTGTPGADGWRINLTQDGALDYTNKIEGRRLADAAIDRMFGGQSLEQKLKDAESVLSGLTRPAKGASSMEDVTAYGEATRKVENLKAQIKAVKDLEEAEKSLRAFEQREGSAVSRIFAQRDDLIGRGANFNRTFTAAHFMASDVLEKGEADNAKQAFGIALTVGKLAADNWDEVYKTLNHVSDATAKDFIAAARAAAQVADELDRIEVNSQRSEIAGRSGKTLTLANIRMGPEREGEAIAFSYRERIRLANELYNFEIDHANTLIEQKRAEADWQRGVFDAEIEHELKVAELQRRRFDERRGMGGELFDAALGGGDGLRQFGSNFLRGQGRTIAGNIFADLTKNVSGYAGLSSKYLQGTMLGADPMKGATDANTLATIANTEALRAVAMSRGGGGGSAVGGFSALWNSIPRSGGGADGATYTEDGEDLGYVSSVANGGMSPWARGIGIGGAAIGGGIGIYAGARQGGARGAMTAAGSGLAAAGAVMSLVSKSLSFAGPAGMIAGAVIGTILPMVLPDRRKQRGDELEREAQSRAYTMPTGADYSMDSSGRYSDYDYRGKTRTSATINIYAMNSQSMVDYFTSNPTILPTALSASISGGNADDVVGLLNARNS